MATNTVKGLIYIYIYFSLYICSSYTNIYITNTIQNKNEVFYSYVTV
jgi:hypothetical protein